MTQKNIIIRHLQETNTWIPAYKLRGISTNFGFIGHQGDRRCRELAQEGKIDHKIEGKYSYYKAKEVSYNYFKVGGSDYITPETTSCFPCNCKNGCGKGGG